MTLLLIIFLLVIFSLLSLILPKYNKFFILFAIIIVILFYFSLSKNFFHIESFYPSNKIITYTPCGNYYNLLINSLKEGNFYIATIKDLYIIDFFDTSVYKKNFYIYFGLTPVLLFYIPFHLSTNLYLTDKFLTFILGCIIFLLYLLILNFFIKKLKLKIKIFIIILSIFLIGICNYSPFLIIRGAIYEVCILTAMLCLLLSIILLFYLNDNDKYKNICFILLGILAALSVGARPHYILFIPILYITILYTEYNKNNKLNNFWEITFLFFTPCIIYGTILATYNFLRFDSFFEFGWKYQVNSINQRHYIQNFNDLFISLKCNFFSIPQIGNKTFFSLVESTQHSRANEYVSGIIYSFPLLLNFVFIFPFIKDSFKSTKIFILLLLVIAITNFTVTSLITGIVTRYVFEYLSILLIISLLIYYYLLKKWKKFNLQLILNILFIIVFIFTIYINISLLFCERNANFFNIASSNNYEKLTKLLF